MSALIHNTCSLHQDSIYPVEILLLVDEYQNTLEIRDIVSQVHHHGLVHCVSCTL